VPAVSRQKKVTLGKKEREKEKRKKERNKETKKQRNKQTTNSFQLDVGTPEILVIRQLDRVLCKWLIGVNFEGKSHDKACSN
jgi:hypothetical protein